VDVKRKILTAASVVFAIASVACSDATPPAPKEPPKPEEPITGRTAFQRVFGTARGWAPDIQILQIQNVNLKEVPSADGKAGAWLITFVSPSRQQARTFSWSAIEGEGFHKGVFSQPPESYSGPRGQASPFLLQALKTDTDEALATAEKRSAEYVKKNPDKPIIFLLEQTRRHPSPTWRVVWGDSVATSNYSVFVDASTGNYVETMR
jgi:hypothetical protein